MKRKTDKERQLSGGELGELARQMIDAPTKAESDVFQEKLIRGFYGGDPPVPTVEELVAKVTPADFKTCLTTQRD